MPLRIAAPFHLPSISELLRSNPAIPLAVAILQPMRHFKLGVNSIKRGQVVELKERIWRVTNKDHVVTGRGGAIVKMDMVEISTGNKIAERFKPGDTLEVLSLEDEPYQFLYHADGKIHLLHPKTFEEMEVPEHMIEGGGRLLPMLEDGMTIMVGILTNTTGEHPVSLRLPLTHEYTVASVTERAVQAAKGISFKSATLANGCRVQVPDFVKVGERIIVEIEEMKYLKRA